MPKHALLNDVNPHLINFLLRLRRGIQIAIDMKNQEELYYSQRQRFNELISHGKARSEEAAALFYYLNRTGYNGLCRFNKKGEFNVPFGEYTTINYVRDFRIYRHSMMDWEFLCKDFEEVPLRRGDFVYADPPYDVEFTQYSKGGFSWDDQVRLAKWLLDHEGPVVLSNQATSRIVALYRGLGYALDFLPAPRMISCNGDRTPAQEVLAWRGV